MRLDSARWTARWGDVAQEAAHAALVLRERGHNRSCVSRAYYAAYSRVTAALWNAGMEFPVQRPGPEHKPLPRLINDRLGRMKRDDRWALARNVRTLYRLRRTADYEPQSAIDNSSMVVALQAMKAVQKMLGSGA